jgi:hypothetical protein
VAGDHLPAVADLDPDHDVIERRGGGFAIGHAMGDELAMNNGGSPVHLNGPTWFQFKVRFGFYECSDTLRFVFDFGVGVGVDEAIAEKGIHCGGVAFLRGGDELGYGFADGFFPGGIGGKGEGGNQEKQGYCFHASQCIKDQSTK